MTENQKTTYAAINKVLSWVMNFDTSMRWMESVWPEKHEHMKRKLTDMCNLYGGMAAPVVFYLEICTEDKIRLLDYIMDNYKGESKLRFE